MALSLNANWLAAMSKSSPEVRWLVTLHVATTTSYQFLSGKCDSITAPESLAVVAPIGREIDVMTRSTRMSSMTIELVRDSNIETILQTYGVYGARLELEIGEASLAEGDFELAGVYVVQSPTVRPSRVILPCAGADYLLDREVIGRWIGDHPLEIIESILEGVGIPTALIDTTAFDPTQYGTTISHFNTSRAAETGMSNTLSINSPTRARDLVDEVAALMDGSVFTQETGIVTFTLFDSTASSVADWTDDDFGDDIEIGPIYENLYNRVEMTTHPSTGVQEGPKEKILGDLTVAQEDATSVDTNFAIINPSAANSSHRLRHKFSTPWINAHGMLQGTIAGTGTGMTFDVAWLETHSFCGARWPGFPSGAQPASAAISAARPCYVRIDDEILKCTAALTISSTQYRYMNLIEPSDGAPTIATDFVTTQPIVPGYLTFTVAARAQLGSVQGAHAGYSSGVIKMVYDVTIQEYLTRSKLNRHSNGVPTIKLRTGLQEFAVEIGDLVTVTTDIFTCRHIDTLDTNTKWEVVGKQIDIQGGNPGIKWVLAYATSTTAPALSVLEEIALLDNGRQTDQPYLMAAGEDMADNTVVSGGVVSGPRTGSFASVADAGGGDVTVTCASYHHIKDGNTVTISGTVNYDGTYTVQSVSADGLSFDVTVAFAITESGTWQDDFAVGITAGVYSSGVAVRTGSSAAAVATCAASKDTYLYWDLGVSSIAQRETALGAGAPTIAAGHVLLAKVVTDANGVTGVTDQRAIKSANLGLQLLNRQQETSAAVNMNPSMDMYTRL